PAPTPTTPRTGWRVHCETRSPTTCSSWWTGTESSATGHAWCDISGSARTSGRGGSRRWDVQSTLNSLQDRVLRVVATVGGWTLTGGGALAGVHLGHRTTEDLDHREPRALEDALVADGLAVSTLQRSPGFVRLAAGCQRAGPEPSAA